MSIHPVLLDARPPFLVNGGLPASGSLLLLPTATGSLLQLLLDQFATITQVRPMVLPRFDAPAEYAAAFRASGADVDVVPSAAALARRIVMLDPGEEILLVDPSCLPSGGYDYDLLLRLANGGDGMARHLMALERTSGRTKEYVHADADGRMRKIQRYYHPQTWPFAWGVACSVVPVASLLTVPDAPLASLPDLRRALASQGAPSQDIPLSGRAVDLTGEDGVLRLVEQGVRERAALVPADVRPLSRGARCTVDPLARLIGPVVLESDVTIEEGAVVAGPTVVGAGAHIGRNAVVAQSLVMPGAAVPSGTVVRHRVVAAGVSATELSATPAARSSSSRQLHMSPVERRTPEFDPGATLYQRVKRTIEFVLALSAMLVLAPVMGLLAAAIKVLDPGPIFFGHEREGRGGRLFRCWKFRTMRVGADAMQRELAAKQQMDGPQFKMDRDPRVTAIGRLLRASNLDELPQLWNVLAGDMSLVGPRPSPFRENQICVPWRQGRLSVRPGITGLWQVCRHDRANGDFHQWIEYDLLYVRNVSAWLDLKILVATVLTLGGKRPVAVARMIPNAVSQPVRARASERVTAANVPSRESQPLKASA